MEITPFHQHLTPNHKCHFKHQDKLPSKVTFAILNRQSHYLNFKSLKIQISMKRIRALEELTRTTNLLSHFSTPPKKVIYFKGAMAKTQGDSHTGV